MELTREQIEQMPAGREMDALIVVAVFGYRKVPNPWHNGRAFFYETPAYQEAVKHGQAPRYGVCTLFNPPGGRAAVVAGRVPKDGWPNELVDFYSTDMPAAWLVAAEMSSQGYDVQLHTLRPGNHVAKFTPAPVGKEWPPRYEALADDMPLAICRAALLARLPTPPHAPATE